MAKKPEPPQPLRWDIYRVANKGKLMAIPGAAIQLGYLAGAQIRATVDDHLIKAFAPKAQACECEAAGDNAKGDGEGVTR
jgi:hypothetical protein